MIDWTKLENQEVEETELAVVDEDVDLPFDIDYQKSKFINQIARLKSFKKDADSLIVNDYNSNEVAVQMAGQLKGLKDSLETKRKEIIGPADRFVRGINAFIKKPRDLIDRIGGTINHKITAYAYDIELKRRQEEKRAQEIIAKRQKEIDASAKKSRVEAPVLPIPVLPKKVEPVRTEDATQLTKMVWVYQIEDEKAVPMEYCIPSDKLIKQAVDAGIRKIAGVRIYEEAKVTIRKN